VPFFSSQEWTETVVDTNTKYIGRWGMTVHSFNRETRRRVSTCPSVPVAPGVFFAVAVADLCVHAIYYSTPGTST
jgi:hypothetical protein